MNIVPTDGNGGALAPMRRMPGPMEVEGWANEKMGEYSDDGRDFTAYEITQAIRAEHPDVEVIHDLVRACVEAGAAAVGYGTVREERFPNGEWARVWEAIDTNPADTDDADVALLPTPVPTPIGPGTPPQLLPGIDPV